MKDYYDIMKLDRKASNDDIKKAFRKLANQYHPDKNPSSEAEALFKELNEAYEVLSDPASRLDYDQRIASPFYTYRGPGNYQQQTHRQYARKGPSEKTMLMNSMLRYSRMLFYFGCMWCCILVVDYTLPERHEVDKVTTDLSPTSSLTVRQPKSGLTTKSGHHVNLSGSEIKHFPYGSELHIYRSSMLNAAIRIENYDNTFVINNLGSIYRNFSFVPILLFLACSIGLIIRKGVEFHINLGIVVFLLMILNIALLFASRI